MRKQWSLIVILIMSVVMTIRIHNLFQLPPIPHLNETWWVDENIYRPQDQDVSIRNFSIYINDEVLRDLDNRLRNARPLTPSLTNTQHYGINIRLLSTVVDYWKHQYRWRERETYLNQFPQYVTNIQGLDIHFIHVKPHNPERLKILPILILHGWPGSIREFYDLIPLLTTTNHRENFVFEVIVPSIPGYGFSTAATKPGLGTTQLAIVFKNLMLRLGIRKFYIQGGDLGSIIHHHMAVLFPHHILGFHNNMCTVFTSQSLVNIVIGNLYPPWVIGSRYYEDHKQRLYPFSKTMHFYMLESGYFHIQATKPDTLGVALSDSPVGLAAYILEKFVTGSGVKNKEYEHGDLHLHFKYVDLLDNIMIYWVTNSMTTAMRLYAETFNIYHNVELGLSRYPITIPTACARFRDDFFFPDGVLGEVHTKLIHLEDYEGGHFAAFQVPHVLAEDIFIGVRKFEHSQPT